MTYDPGLDARLSYDSAINELRRQKMGKGSTAWVRVTIPDAATMCAWRARAARSGVRASRGEYDRRRQAVREGDRVIDQAQEQKSQRVAEIRCAYGCRADDAREIAEGKTRFARGAQHFGPMFCWYVKDRYQWTLFGQPREKGEITRAAKIPDARFGKRRLRTV